MRLLITLFLAASMLAASGPAQASATATTTKVERKRPKKNLRLLKKLRPEYKRRKSHHGRPLHR